MDKLIVMLFITFLIMLVSFGVGIAVMVFGWGLTPHSWFAIIGGAIFQMILTVVSMSAGALIKKD